MKRRPAPKRNSPQSLKKEAKSAAKKQTVQPVETPRRKNSRPKVQVVKQGSDSKGKNQADPVKKVATGLPDFGKLLTLLQNGQVRLIGVRNGKPEEDITEPTVEGLKKALESGIISDLKNKSGPLVQLQWQLKRVECKDQKLAEELYWYLTIGLLCQLREVPIDRQLGF